MPGFVFLQSQQNISNFFPGQKVYPQPRLNELPAVHFLRSITLNGTEIYEVRSNISPIEPPRLFDTSEQHLLNRLEFGIELCSVSAVPYTEEVQRRASIWPHGGELLLISREGGGSCH